MVETKNDKLSASLEDYLEAIFNLVDKSDSSVAHSTDIAKMLGVSKPSVTGALKILKKKGLANYKPYDCVTLTKAGQRSAAKIVQKHDILKSFFVDVLGVGENVAQQAACKAEHALGPKVISRLLCFIEFVMQKGKDGYDLSSKFREFCKGRSQNSNFSKK